MAPKSIFISYRRDDSAGHAGRIKDRLEREFGDSCRLFMDVDAIPLGVDFTKHLTEEVANCDVLLAVIGRQWVELRDETGNRRLDQQNDYVRIEIGVALQRNIPVIPLVLGGAKMPKAELLPDDLKALSVRNSLDLHDASFQSDLDRLVRELKRRFFPEGAGQVPPSRQPDDAEKPRPVWLRLLLSTVSLAAGAAVGFFGGLFC
jgi:TIR domain